MSIASLEPWPIVLITFPAVVEDEHIATILTVLERAYARQDKFVVLADTSAMTAPPNAKQRAALTDFAKRHHVATIERALGTALVVRSGFIRAAITALDWLYPRPTPTACVATPAEAMAWCTERLAAAGVASRAGPKAGGFVG